MKQLTALCLTSIALVATAHCGITKPYKKETVSSKSETKFGKRTVSEGDYGKSATKFERRTVSERDNEEDGKSETKFGKRSLTSKDQVANRKSRVTQERATRQKARRSSGGGGGRKC